MDNNISQEVAEGFAKILGYVCTSVAKRMVRMTDVERLEYENKLLKKELELYKKKIQALE